MTEKYKMPVPPQLANVDFSAPYHVLVFVLGNGSSGSITASEVEQSLAVYGDRGYRVIHTSQMGVDPSGVRMMMVVERFSFFDE